MQSKSIHILYLLSAFLSDKTNGFSLFSKWKIALGSILLGVMAVSCTTQKEGVKNTTPTDSTNDKQDAILSKCYKTVVPKDTVVGQVEDTIPLLILPIDIKTLQEPIMCYVPMFPPNTEQIKFLESFRPQKDSITNDVKGTKQPEALEEANEK